MLFNIAKEGSYFYLPMSIITTEIARYLLYFIISKLRHALPFKDTDTNVISHRTFLIHAFAAGAGIGSAQALESMSPFFNSGYTDATLYSTIQSPPLIATSSTLSLCLFIFQSSITILAFIMYNKASRSKLKTICVILMFIIVQGIVRIPNIALLPSLSPDNSTSVISLINSLSSDPNSSFPSASSSLAACLTCLIVSIVVCVVALISSDCVMQGKIRLINESEVYGVKQE
ncbi:putative Aph-1 protein [Monocercomonoides exilis]|uniref:putative Aph-1 protein n=1 Tax=Monocercomonoides exilis TaxID=2049356 RepID=UPI00355A7E76|nr:putative Aph-1 protein [Monocercomonoides exilis]|eukprot:MONOS_3357.1-p1 / transcript=MONOS_3357.1 / gene=MONOS_3357 / organism=Monocercomonoides_exilis_PA203 / gene_product=unspecified product / transcript_product=unspecified product / location=Mono_scaffold00078:105975-106855(+) / protein_length=230 / sequence_SO=supercontig / SO=protein_coding / is_pseudo=false